MAGWDDINAVQNQKKPSASDIDKLCVRVLNTEDGKKLMQWLRNQTLERPRWIPGADAANGYFAEGRASIVRDLETKIRRGLDG
tara:strand:+ start:272 stop:523 length:252 start_codon:yes stop_codon:yes gene_type:complete